MSTPKKLNKEDFVTNNLLNNIESHFNVNSKFAVTCVKGSFLKSNKKVDYNKALTETSKELNKFKKDYVLDPDKTYVILYEIKTNTIVGIVPYGANMPKLCFGYLIKSPKKDMSQDEINNLLTRIYQDCLQNIVLEEFLKYYNSKQGTIDRNSLDSLEFQQLQNDPDNIVIKAKINIKYLKQPLKSVVLSQKKDINYSAIAPTPISYIGLDDKNDYVNLVFSLY